MPFMASIEATTGFGRPVRPPVQSAQPSGGIVTNGLIIQLDASNATSYPGSGTTWFDITSTNNGTLTNGATFTSSDPKYFNFDGVDDYVNIPDVAAIRPSIGGAVTGIIWAYITSYTAFDGLISKQFGAPTYDGFSLVLNTTNRVALNMNGGSVNGNYNSANTNVFSLNTWTMFTCVVRFGGGAGNPSRAYVNTTEVVSAANTESSIPSNTAPLRLVSGIQEGSPYPACRVGGFYYYNRALSAAEISTMFTATRTRYGV
jgi:hypothetical protein